jgi:hypothetical protein
MGHLTDLMKDTENPEDERIKFMAGFSYFGNVIQKSIPFGNIQGKIENKEW